MSYMKIYFITKRVLKCNITFSMSLYSFTNKIKENIRKKVKKTNKNQLKNTE